MSAIQTAGTFGEGTPSPSSGTSPAGGLGASPPTSQPRVEEGRDKMPLENPAKNIAETCPGNLQEAKLTKEQKKNSKSHLLFLQKRPILQKTPFSLCPFSQCTRGPGSSLCLPHSGKATPPRASTPLSFNSPPLCPSASQISQCPESCKAKALHCHPVI